MSIFSQAKIDMPSHHVKIDMPLGRQCIPMTSYAGMKKKKVPKGMYYESLPKRSIKGHKFWDF